MLIRFDNKTALITGGTSGIGLACADLFGSLGAKVAICGTNPGKLDKALEGLRGKGITAFGETCDVSDGASLEAFCAHALAELGSIDIWASNAGIYPQYSIIDTSEEIWNEAIDTNLKSAYYGARIGFRAMKERGGVMLLASSFASLIPSVGSGVYALTKAAINSMVKTLAAEMAPYGIRVNGYIPGVIDTDLNKGPIAEKGEQLLAPISLRSFGHAIDVAWAMAFLASDYARYITGATLEISGGKMCVQNPDKAWMDKEARE